jgi:hypothetical protein
VKYSRPSNFLVFSTCGTNFSSMPSLGLLILYTESFPYKNGWLLEVYLLSAMDCEDPRWPPVAVMLLVPSLIL